MVGTAKHNIVWLTGIAILLFVTVSVCKHIKCYMCGIPEPGAPNCDDNVTIHECGFDEGWLTRCNEFFERSDEGYSVTQRDCGQMKYDDDDPGKEDGCKQYEPGKFICECSTDLCNLNMNTTTIKKLGGLQKSYTEDYKMKPKN